MNAEEALALTEALVRFFVTKNGIRNNEDFLDACEEGRLVVIRSAARYDPRRGTPANFFGRQIDGAIKHWLRDRARQIRIPGYVYDEGRAEEYAHELLSFDLLGDRDGADQIDEIDRALDRVTLANRRRAIEKAAEEYLTPAERKVLADILSGKSIKQIAAGKKVRVGCVYTQRHKAIARLRAVLTAGATS